MTSTGHAWPNQTVIAHTSVEAQPLIGRHNLPVFVGAIPEWRAQPSIPIKLCCKRDYSLSSERLALYIKKAAISTVVTCVLISICFMRLN